MELRKINRIKVRFTDEDIQKVARTHHNWQREGSFESYADVPEFCYSASLDEIKTKGFDYNTRMKELQGELTDILRKEAESRAAVLEVFKFLGYEIKI